MKLILASLAVVSASYLPYYTANDQHTTTLIPDGCMANTVDDQIEYVKLTGNSGDTITGTVGYKPLHSGGWTMSSGVSVQCWHYADTWDFYPILDKQDSGIGYGYGYGNGPSRTHVFSYQVQRSSVFQHYIRCGIIDRSSSFCQFDSNTHCATSSAGSAWGHHYDNADAPFYMVDDITTSPTASPTTYPTTYPTAYPTAYPTPTPTTYYPTSYPTAFPTAYPTTYPTTFPTTAPTAAPTADCPVSCNLLTEVAGTRLHQVTGKKESHKSRKVLVTHNVYLANNGASFTQHRCYRSGTQCLCECLDKEENFQSGMLHGKAFRSTGKKAIPGQHSMKASFYMPNQKILDDSNRRNPGGDLIKFWADRTPEKAAAVAGVAGPGPEHVTPTSTEGWATNDETGHQYFMPNPTHSPTHSPTSE